MDDYFDTLDALLLENEDCMLLSELDGFLTGIAVSPDPIPPSLWLRRIWYGGAAPFDDDASLEQFVRLVTRHYEAVLDSLARPGGYEPVMDIDSRNGDTLWEVWAEGFAAAMRLGSTGWNRLRASDDQGAAAALAGVSELVAIAEGRVTLSDDEEARRDRDSAVLIATWMHVLYDWRQDTARNTTVAKPGRNDPCSCGSGTKYKKCCGRN